jgi:nitrogenase molybdenum-iron protein alpha/beta subunit
MSIGGTKAWLRRVGKHLGVEQRANDVIAQELRRLKPSAELARRQLAGRRFALFADAPRAAGAVAALMEVGMAPGLIGTLHFHCGGREEVERRLREDHEIELPPGVEWLENPTPAAVGQARIDGCDVAFGTTIERQQLARRCPTWVEFGFPSDDRHFVFPAPDLGFDGALRLWEQTMQALAQARTTEVDRGSPRR